MNLVAGDIGENLKGMILEEKYISWSVKGCPRGVMVKVMDCGIVVREFVLQSRY